MLFIFKSPVAADVILLPDTAARILKVIGKSDGNVPDAKGIITSEQVPAAVDALRAAIAAEENAGAHEGLDKKGERIISLRQRATPFIALLTATADAGKDVVWGV